MGHLGPAPAGWEWCPYCDNGRQWHNKRRKCRNCNGFGKLKPEELKAFREKYAAQEGKADADTSH